MRLWSLSVEYLDARGVVALWREALLARSVLMGRTQGYVNHPQLCRFKACERPLDAIEYYLNVVFREAQRRGYNFDQSKIRFVDRPSAIDVTGGQLEYEFEHLKNKLKLRAPLKCSEIAVVDAVRAHPLFNIVVGDVEPWERVK